MGVAPSSPEKHSQKPHHGGTNRNRQKTGWTQHYQNYSQTAPKQPNPPPPSVTKHRKNPGGGGGVVIQQSTVHQPANPPILVTTTTRIQQSTAPSGQPKRGGTTKVDYSTVECGVCGHTGHGTRFCHHRNQTCHICFKQGHIASVCKQKVHHEGSRYKPKQRK